MATPTSYTYSVSSDITAQKLNSSRLHQEINDSAISTAISGINSATGSDSFEVAFKDALSTEDETTLTATVLAHTGESIISIQQVEVTETTPFAKPDYRTKMDAIPNWTTCSPDTDTVMDFTLMEERYVTGGEIIFKNAKEGDYITACVYDGFNGGVIPEAYRADLCEAWPIVATYVEKRYLVPTITDGFGVLALDTYPLNAKISQYLQLRVIYHSTAEVGDRRATVNYNLTQKL